MHRPIGARLAVPLLIVIVLTGGWIGLAALAAAMDGCVPTPDGIVCGYRGRSTSTTVARGGGLPPLRYLATPSGTCWYWSRYPPGLDSWDSGNDHEIIFTRFRLPECRGRSAPPPTVITSERAWEIFRSFPLEDPDFELSPEIGITNLPTLLRVERADEFEHSERLPDGRTLEVEAWVEVVWVDWGDGTPTLTVDQGRRWGRNRGSSGHAYGLKTCPADYRENHIDGGKCHPHLDAYRVQVTFEWHGRYRAGGGWIEIGTIDRSSSRRHDVDEVLGVLVSP